jgi:hypothetical protein
MYMYICLQFEELFSHLPLPTGPIASIHVTHTLSGSTSEHRGSNDSMDFYRHRVLERRGSNKYHHLEHRGSTRFHTQHRVATRAYALSSTSLSHLILISLLSIAPGFYFTRKQSPIDLVAPYYFIIRGISVDSTAP